VWGNPGSRHVYSYLTRHKLGKKSRKIKEAKIAQVGNVSFRHSRGVIPEVDKYIHI